MKATTQTQTVKASNTTQAKAAQTVVKAKATPAKASAKASATKPTAATQQATKTVTRITVPGNRPTAGKYLFAYTYACIQIIEKMPKAIQAKAAKAMHGTSALSHHGANGTKKMLVGSDGSMQYDKGFFSVGTKSTDEKRKEVPESWVNCFVEYMRTGSIKTSQDGFVWKAVATPLIVISY